MPKPDPRPGTGDQAPGEGPREIDEVGGEASGTVGDGPGQRLGGGSRLSLADPVRHPPPATDHGAQPDGGQCAQGGRPPPPRRGCGEQVGAHDPGHEHHGERLRQQRQPEHGAHGQVGPEARPAAADAGQQHRQDAAQEDEQVVVVDRRADVDELRQAERQQGRRRPGPVVAAEPADGGPGEKRERNEQQHVGEPQDPQLAIERRQPVSGQQPSLHPHQPGHRLVVERRMLRHLVVDVGVARVVLVAELSRLGVGLQPAEILDVGPVGAIGRVGRVEPRPGLGQVDEVTLAVEADLLAEPAPVEAGVAVPVGQVEHEVDVRRLVGGPVRGHGDRPQRPDQGEGRTGEPHDPRRPSPAGRARRTGRRVVGRSLRG